MPSLSSRGPPSPHLSDTTPLRVHIFSVTVCCSCLHLGGLWTGQSRARQSPVSAERSPRGSQGGGCLSAEVRGLRLGFQTWTLGTGSAPGREGRCQHQPRLEVEAETGVFEKVGGREEALTAGKAGDGCETVVPLISPRRCGDGAHMDRSTGNSCGPKPQCGCKGTVLGWAGGGTNGM